MQRGCVSSVSAGCCVPRSCHPSRSGNCGIYRDGRGRPYSMGTGSQCRAAVGGRDAVLVERHDEGCTDITFGMGESRRQ